VLLDVRLEGEYNEAHAEGAVNAQLYRLIKKVTAALVAGASGVVVGNPADLAVVSCSGLEM
jgi:hypothetical protein